MYCAKVKYASATRLVLLLRTIDNVKAVNKHAR